MPAAFALLAEIAQVPIDSATLALATAIGPPESHSLGALHLASAARIAVPADDELVFVAYDVRLRRAAADLGLAIAHRGS